MRKLLATVVLSLFMVSCFAGYSSGGRSGFSGGSRSFSSGSYSRGSSGYSSGRSYSYARPSYNSSRSYNSSYYRAPSSRSNTTIVNNHSSGGGMGGGFWSGMLGGYMGASMAQHPVVVGGGYGQPMVAGGGVMMDGGVAPVVTPGIGYYSGFSPLAWLLTMILIFTLLAIFIRYILCDHDHY